MINYNNDHQFIIKTFPFVLFEVCESGNNYLYYVNNESTFWFSILYKWWNGYYDFGGTNNINSFLVQIYEWVLKYYGKIL